MYHRWYTRGIDEGNDLFQSAQTGAFISGLWGDRELFIERATVAVLGMLALAVGVRPDGEALGLRPKEHRIPFFSHSGMIYIPAVVNKNHATLLLDTGAGTTAFVTKIAPPGHADAMTNINTARGSMIAFHVPVEFTLGGQSRKDGSCSFSRNVLVGNFTFEGADGVIGLDVLRSFKIATIDFENSVLVLEDR